MGNLVESEVSIGDASQKSVRKSESAQTCGVRRRDVEVREAPRGFSGRSLVGDLTTSKMPLWLSDLIQVLPDTTIAIRQVQNSGYVSIAFAKMGVGRPLGSLKTLVLWKELLGQIGIHRG